MDYAESRQRKTIANSAWGGQWDAKEIMIAMGAHATTENLNNCPDFTVAFATKQTMVAADFVGIVSAKNDADKMAKTGWNVEKAENVNAPVFTDFPMTLECRIKEKIDESAEGYYIVAEIVNILVDEKYLAEDGKPDVEKMQLFHLRLGYPAGVVEVKLLQVMPGREAGGGEPSLKVSLLTPFKFHGEYSFEEL